MLALVWSSAALVAVVGTLVLLRLLGWGGRWAERLSHSDVLTFLSILVAVLALYVSVKTILEARQGGEAQQRVLESSRAALEGVLRTLESERASMDKSAAALEVHSETLRRVDDRLKVQGEIIAAQERRTLARLKQRPRVQLLAGGVPMKPSGGGTLLPTVEETATRTTIHLTLTNTGTETLRQATWRAFAFASPGSGVTLRCPGCTYAFENGKITTKFALLGLEALRAGNSIDIPLIVDYIADCESFDVQFNVDGENMLPQELGSFTISPRVLGK